MKKLFLRDGKLWAGEFPEEPSDKLMEGVDRDAYPKAIQKYHAALESAKESAVEVVSKNCDNVFGVWCLRNYKHDIIIEFEEGQLYDLPSDLPSGWTVETTWQQKSSTKQDAAWLDCTYDTAVLKLGFESRKIAPPHPLRK